MEKKMNNKGFSLVELIIVIAIMAVLVGILAPQFLKYVERSRNSTDITNAQEITAAIQAYAADPEATDTFATDAGTTIKITKTADPAISGTNATAVKNGLVEAGVSTTKCKSKTKWTEYTITVVVDANGKVSFKYSDTAFGE